jgi:ketosteroid isomerase-like protein
MDAEVERVPLLMEPEGASYHGHDGIRKRLDELFAVLPDFSAKIEEVRDLGDMLVVAAHTRGHGTDSDVPFEQTVRQVVKLRQGTVVRWRNSWSRTEALEAVERRTWYARVRAREGGRIRARRLERSITKHARSAVEVICHWASALSLDHRCGSRRPARSYHRPRTRRARNRSSISSGLAGDRVGYDSVDRLNELLDWFDGPRREDGGRRSHDHGRRMDRAQGGSGRPLTNKVPEAPAPAPELVDELLPGEAAITEFLVVAAGVEYCLETSEHSRDLGVGLSE